MFSYKIQSNSVITSWKGLNTSCRFKRASLYLSSITLQLTVRNYLVSQNMWRYRRGVVQADVIISGCDCNPKKVHLTCREYLFICNLYNDNDRY